MLNTQKENKTIGEVFKIKDSESCARQKKNRIKIKAFISDLTTLNKRHVKMKLLD